MNIYIYIRLPYGLNLNQFPYLNMIVVKSYNHLNIILITKNMHIAVIIFHYKLHVTYNLQFKYLYLFYAEFKSEYIRLGGEMFRII